MNYLNVYLSIIQKTKTENRLKLRKSHHSYIYYENHHIIPRCLNGSDDKNNMVLLTAREHFVCHKLLTYIYPGNYKIYNAFHLMTFMNKRKYGITSRDYKYAIELFRLIPRDHKGEKNPMFGKGYKLLGEKNGMFHKSHKKESIKKMKEHVFSEEHKKHLSESLMGKYSGNKNGMFGKCAYTIWIEKFGIEEANKRKQINSEKISNAGKGKKRSEESKIKYKKAALNRKKYKCEHCNKEFAAGNFKQHVRKLETLRVKELGFK